MLFRSAVIDVYGDGFGDVLGFGEFLEGDFGGEFGDGLFAPFVGHVGFDRRGADGVDVDVVGGHLQGHAFGQADDAGFAGGIVGAGGQPAER